MAHTLDRTLISVAGEDATAFLHNLLTQNLEGMEDGAVRYAALLSPQGKVTTDMFVWRTGARYLLDAPASRGSDLLRRLMLYKLRSRVVIADANAELVVCWDESRFSSAQPDPRLADLGWRALSARRESAGPSGDEGLARHALSLGVPDLARDAAPEEVFALEALLYELSGVDMNKGCYVGQENVSRMMRRATTRKKFCPIEFDGDAPASGTPVQADGVDVGVARRVIPGRAMTLLRLDRALDALADGVMLTINGAPARLAPPPWLILPQRQAEGD